jgi:hypothetical protein
MKKLLLLLAVILSGCTCVLSQIPPQYVFVGANCQAPLPNYVPQVVVTDNCSIKSVVQTPIPGTILSATNPMVTVVIRATDAFDNFSEVSFTVTAKDTQPPVITPSGDLLADNWIKIDNMYDAADKMVAEQEAYFDATFDWSSMPDSVRSDNQYNEKMMLTWTSPAHATTGYGSRVITWVSNNDTFTIK